MVQLFTDRYRDERPAGDFFRFVRFWGGIFGDLLRTALSERTESVMSSFKQQWWKWAIGLVAILQGVFLIESVFRVMFDGLGSSRWTLDLAGLIVSATTITAIVIGLRSMNRRPRMAGLLLAFGMIPVAAAGVILFWFPPMWLVSVAGIYLATRALMEAGRLSRAIPIAT